MRLARVVLQGGTALSSAGVRATPSSMTLRSFGLKSSAAAYGGGRHEDIVARLRPAILVRQRHRQAARDDSITVSTREYMFDLESDKIRDKKQFLALIEKFKEGNPNRRGHVEFIKAALHRLEEFQVHKDMEVYKELMDLFPKKKMIAKTLIASEFWHFPRHQDTAIELLGYMQRNKVYPDRELRQLVLQTFGPESHVFRMLSRMCYWMPKFKNASPYPLPRPLPTDPRALARLAIEQITGVDLETEVVDLHCSDVPDSIDKTWIVSGQSRKQRELLLEETGKVPLWIEGPKRVWLRDVLISYFCLMGEFRPKPEISINADDVSNIKLTMFGEKVEPSQDLTLLPCVHEMADATVFAVCATGTSSRDSLLSWLRLLQQTNPCLEHLPVVFKLLAPTKALAKFGKDPANEKWTDEMQALEDARNSASEGNHDVDDGTKSSR